MEKRYETGLVLGKFYGIHLGHLHLIDTAAEQCEIVYVMMCSLEKETIPGAIRFAWLWHHYKANSRIRIIHCTDENPQYPEDCSSADEFYNTYWVPTVHKYIEDEIEVVFTSEDYGDEFAKYLGVGHVLVDRERTTYPVSGTKIRESSYDNWEFIPYFAKPYFMKRVVIVGPESTGKSTLTKKLAQHYNTEYVEEYGRTYTNKTGTDNLSVEDFEEIVHGQFRDNFDYKNDDTKLLFCDTEAITTKIFAEMYIGMKKNDLIDDKIKQQKFDLWLLLDVDVNWIDDGTRDFPHKREWHMNKIKDELNSRDIKYVVISGDYDERFEKAKIEVNKLLK